MMAEWEIELQQLRQRDDGYSIGLSDSLIVGQEKSADWDRVRWRIVE